MNIYCCKYCKICEPLKGFWMKPQETFRENYEVFEMPNSLNHYDMNVDDVVILMLS